MDSMKSPEIPGQQPSFLDKDGQIDPKVAEQINPGAPLAAEITKKFVGAMPLDIEDAIELVKSGKAPNADSAIQMMLKEKAEDAKSR